MKKIKGVTVALLKSLEIRAFLLCPECQSEYSADASDYWTMPEDQVFVCCRVPNKLMEKVITYREVKRP
jgi:hypothetical protein